MGKVIIPPLDQTGTDLPPGSVRRHIRPPQIHGPPEIHAYTNSDDNENDDEEPNDIASLCEQLATLRLCLNNMDERVLGILASRINPQAHLYHCIFHLKVFPGLSNPQGTCVHSLLF